MNPQTKTYVLNNESIDFLIAKTIKSKIIEESEVKNFRNADSYKKIELLNRIALAIPFDYSPLIQIFDRNLSVHETVLNSFYKSITEEPFSTIDFLKSNGTGASCLSGAVLTSQIYKTFGYDSNICIASKIQDISLLKPENMHMVHFAIIVNDNNAQYYSDPSLNLLHPINLELGKTDNDLLSVKLTKNNLFINVNVNSKNETKYLWSIINDHKKYNLSELSALMAQVLNPMRRKNPVQYIRLSTIVSGENVSALHSTAEKKDIFRLNLKYDDQEGKYVLQLKNKETSKTKQYNIYHNPHTFNSVNIAQTSELRHDLYSIANINIEESFFEQLNSLNKKLIQHQHILIKP